MTKIIVKTYTDDRRLLITELFGTRVRTQLKQNRHLFMEQNVCNECCMHYLAYVVALCDYNLISSFNKNSWLQVTGKLCN